MLLTSPMPFKLASIQHTSNPSCPGLHSPWFHTALPISVREDWNLTSRRLWLLSLLLSRGFSFIPCARAFCIQSCTCRQKTMWSPMQLQQNSTSGESHYMQAKPYPRYRGNMAKKAQWPVTCVCSALERLSLLPSHQQQQARHL